MNNSLSAAGVMMCAAISFYGCSPQCSDENLSSFKDTVSGQYALKFSRNCGATVGDNVQIAISDNGTTYDDDRVVFVADGGGTTNLNSPLDYVDVNWSEGKLTITYDKRLQVFKRKGLARLQIEFEAR